MARGSRGSGKWAGFGGGYTPAVVGGGAPAWVPANAVIHIDLVGGDPQGRAWVQGTGEVAVETLLGSDPNTDNVVSSGYNPTNPTALDANGYGGSNAYDPAFIGNARTLVLAGCTLRVQFWIQSGGADNLAVYLMSADGADSIEVRLRTTTNHRAYIDSFSGDLMVLITDIVNVASGAINVVACTISGTRAELAVNGAAAVTGVIGEDDRPTANPLVAAVVQCGNHRIQSITLYDPYPSTTGLSELSEIT